MPFKVLLLLSTQALLSTQVFAAKCFHNSVPFLTKELACATMGDDYSDICLRNMSPPLLFIPQFLATLVANADKSNTSYFTALQKSSVAILTNYADIVMQQESRFLQASIVANQTCIDAFASNSTTVTQLDLDGAKTKLQQAQDNYDTAQVSYSFANASYAQLTIKKRNINSKACNGVVFSNSYYSSNPVEICKTAGYFNCLTKAHKNCIVGLGADSIAQAHDMNPVEVTSVDLNTGSCSSDSISSRCKAMYA